LVVFYLAKGSDQAVDKGSLVIYVGVWFVSSVDKVGILIDLKIF